MVHRTGCECEQCMSGYEYEGETCEDDCGCIFCVYCPWPQITTFVLIIGGIVGGIYGICWWMDSRPIGKHETEVLESWVVQEYPINNMITEAYKDDKVSLNEYQEIRRFVTEINDQREAEELQERVRNLAGEGV